MMTPELAVALESPFGDDTGARLAAYSDLDSCMVLEAAAGTGKTTTLTERVVNLLLCGRIQPSSLVAITFTKASAAELVHKIRERIATRLLDMPAAGTASIAPLSDIERERLLIAERRLNEAHISTIHSFCSSILREYPMEAGVDPRWKMMEEIEEKQLFEECWRAWMAEHLSQADPEMTSLLEAGVTTADMRKLAELLFEERDLLHIGDPGSPTALHWNDMLPGRPLQPSEGAALAMEATDILSRLGSAPLGGVVNGGRLNAFLRCCRDNLTELSGVDGQGTGEPRPYMLRGGNLGPDKAHKAHCAPSMSDFLQEKLNRGQEIPEEVSRLLTAADDLFERVRRYDHARQNGLIRSLCVRLEGFFRSLSQARSARGALSNLDLLLFTKILLRDHPDVRRSCKDRYKAILVDEAQDTDPLQTEIVLFLSERPEDSATDASQVRLDPSKLFVVGDPKQSIYRFRRADVELFEQTAAAIQAANGERKYLSSNFRSAAQIVDWTNDVFRSAMMPEDPSVYQARYVPLRAGDNPRQRLTALEPGVTMLRPPACDHNADVTEARHIAAWIGQLKRDRMVESESDIAILVRKRTHVDRLMTALSNEGVPTVTVGRGTFQSSPEFSAVAHTLMALCDPSDKVAVVTALRCFLFGVPDHELLLHHSAGRSLDYTAEEASEMRSMTPVMAKAFSVLARVHQMRSRDDSVTLLRTLFELTGAWQVCFARDAGEAGGAVSPRAQRLRRILGMARKHGLGSHRGSFARFASHLELCIGEKNGTDDPPAFDEGVHAVRVMTMHQCKGLEFPVVALAQMSDGANHRSPRLIVERPRTAAARPADPVDPADPVNPAHLSKPSVHIKLGTSLRSADWDEASARDEARGRAEALRLLYVACTRAQEHLAVSLYHQDRGLMSGLPYPAATPTDDADERIAAGDDLTVMQQPAPPVLPHHRALLFGSAEPAPDGLPELEDPETQGWMRMRSEPADTGGPTRFRSPSSSHEPPKTAADDGADESVTSPPTQSRRTRGGGSRMGTAFHRVMETAISGAYLTNRLVEAESFANSLSAKESRDLQQLVDAAMKHPIIQRALAADRRYAELPFCVPDHRTGVGGQMVDGSIDLLFEEGDALVIVDYKTDAIAGAEIDARFEEYKSQGIDYAWAAHQATGRPIKEAAFLFVRSGESRRISPADLSALGIPTARP